jgi:hypothetical protein
LLAMQFQERYGGLRRELLDLSMRNSLLNYRPSKARGVHVKGESGKEVYEILVNHGKTMTFLPRKGLEVNLSPHFEDVLRQLQPLDFSEEDSGANLSRSSKFSGLRTSLDKVSMHLEALLSRAQKSGDEAKSSNHEQGALQLVEELGLTIMQNQKILGKLSSGSQQSFDEGHPEYIIKSLHHEIKVLKDECLVRVEDAASGSSRQKEWLAPLSDEELQDLHLQTNESDHRLQRRLLNTYHEARTHIEERGVNLLFLSIGALKWSEKESPTKIFNAPLLLIPVKLERAAIRERYKLSYLGDDIEENMSLAAKLEQDYGIKLPGFPLTEDLDPYAYFEAVGKAFAGQQNWKIINDEIHLGFFSFAKLLMYHDLDSNRWPDGLKPFEHPILRSILSDGFNEPASIYNEGELLDHFLRPQESNQVMDADGSQLKAILDVRDGRNLIIQGPPGTGKSQTITNLIAESIGQGKSVLFVAEKMAALDVVKRRLHNVNLGGACLEIHSHNSNKKMLISELDRTMRQGRILSNDELQEECDQLYELRERLNSYSQEINTPIAETDYSLFDVYGEMSQLHRLLQDSGHPGQPEHLSAKSMTVCECTRSELDQKTNLVQKLQEHLKTMGQPSAHPFQGSMLESWGPALVSQLETGLSSTLESHREMLRSLNALSQHLGFGNPEKSRQAKRLIQNARRASEAPGLNGVNIDSPIWEEGKASLEELIKAGVEWNELHAEHDVTIRPEVWGADMNIAREAIIEHGRKWWKILIGDYRRARREIQKLCHMGITPKDPALLVEICDAILREAKLRVSVENGAEVGGKLFSDKWKATSSDWDWMNQVNQYVPSVREAIKRGELDRELLQFLHDKPDGASSSGLEADAAESSCDRFLENIERSFDLLNYDKARREDISNEWLFALQDQLLVNMAQHLDLLPEQAVYNQIAGQLSENGMYWVLLGAWTWDEAPRCLVYWFRIVFLKKLCDEVLEKNKSLREFSRLDHDKTINQFQDLDRLLLLINRRKLAMKHWAQMPAMYDCGQLGVLNREFGKRIRHLPIRKLMKQAGRAIQSIKPVFMMSPMSIASFLPPGLLQFDLVIFDEASQVKPVDAFGAILRGSQLIVVGDSKQLPPTGFFDTKTSGTDNEADECIQTEESESILDMMESKGVPQRMLNWHFRSRDQSLITVSNREFYDDQLVVFPSPNPGDSELGLAYQHLPDTVYERGASGTNPLESCAVAEAVFRHAREHPEYTLGVVAFSNRQMQAIVDEMERMRRSDPSCEEFFSSHPHEPFFIKNLENVQGDERDVIFISVGYGKDEHGKVSMNFGPLNNEGGERRLNVLITRAKRRCEVFTNIRHTDIDMSRTNAQGVRSFKTFLRYAETKELKNLDPQ